MKLIDVVIIIIFGVLILYGEHAARFDKAVDMEGAEDVARDIRKVRGQLDILATLLKVTLEDFNQTAGAKLDQLHKLIDQYSERMTDATRLFRDGIIVLAAFCFLSICVVSLTRYYCSSSTDLLDNQIQSLDMEQTEEILSLANGTLTTETGKTDKPTSNEESENVTNDDQTYDRKDSFNNSRADVAIPVLTAAFLLSLTNMLMKNPHLSNYLDIPWHVIVYFALGFLVSYTCHLRVPHYRKWHCRHHSIIICSIFLLFFVFFFYHLSCDAQHLTFSICTLISSGGGIFFVTIYSIIIYYQDKVPID